MGAKLASMNPLLCRTTFLLLLALFQTVKVPKKNQQQAYLYRPDQTVDLDSKKTVAAKEQCENWALAAGLEAMLQEQKVALDQSYWVMRMNGGLLCVSTLPPWDTLARLVNREFVLDDGRHVRLELNFSAGAPADIDSIIARLQRQQVSLMIWHGHPYYLVGATYDEHVGRDGSRLYEIKELRLANTFAGVPGVTFQKGRDDAREIGGVVTVSASQL
jgi:hypothetical protein